MNKDIFKSTDNQIKVYHNWFTCKEEIINGFQIASRELKKCKIIFADYYGDYDGTAHVIFMKNGKLYEVNGSHCSCNGLEDQWIPEETSIEALMFRPNVSEFAKHNLKHIKDIKD